MHTLRSPKDYTGPDLDVPSLTYQSWHTAKYGEESWAELDLIPRHYWSAYLQWVRQMTRVPVRNHTEAIDISPAGELLEIRLREHGENEATVFARKVVLATGQDGTGIPMPLVPVQTQKSLITQRDMPGSSSVETNPLPH